MVKEGESGMKVICDRAALVDALTLVGAVVAQRTPKPALTCVRLTAEEGTLMLDATDMEVSVRMNTPRVEVAEPGAALVPAGKLNDIVKEAHDPTLTIETQQEQALITGQDSKFRIFGYPVGDFPELPSADGDVDFTIGAAELHRLVSMTVFATARENSRYAMSGVLFDREKNKLAVVATDGHRLAMARGACKSTTEEQATAIVPLKALNLLLRLFDDEEQTVSVKVDGGQIVFWSDNAVLISKLQEGNFPPYRDVIPKDGDKKATVATDLLISGVRQAALLTNEESKGVRLSFSDQGLTLTSRAPEMGDAEINVEVSEFQGEAIEIGFNPQYLLDALKVVDEEQVHMEFKASNKPGVLRTGPNFLYVVMPVNLQ